MTLKGSRNVISSPGLPAGPLPSNSRGGRKPDPSGPAPAPANLSLSPVNVKGKKIPATSGQSSTGLSPSAVLQSCLANRLQARMDVNGSPEFLLTWKLWYTRLGSPICALRASVRPTSGSDYGGWPSPMAGVHLAVGIWATPSANEMRTTDKAQLLKRRAECKARNNNGNGFGLTLGNQATLFLASTENSGALNPDFSRWLMGYPPEWGNSAPTATRSSRKSPQNS